MTPEKVEEHNRLFGQATQLIKGELIVHGQKLPSYIAQPVRAKLEQALGLYARVLEINPENWSAMWLVGKVHQRLDDNAAALKWFTEAQRIKPDHPDILREAGMTALAIGAKEEALRLCFTAVRLSPDDLGLQSNLALAYLLAGDDEHAEECAKVAASRAPEDTISRAVLALVEDVRKGKKQRPKRIIGTP